MTTYREAYSWIDQEYPFFYTLVLNLGRGVEDESIPTAAVRQNPEAPEGWEMAYNPTYFAQLSPEHGGAVFSHEALHAVLKHLSELQDDRFPNKGALTKAHECIVNDRLVAAGMTFPGEPYYGPKFLGVDTSPYTTEEVYEMVVKQEEEREEEKQEGEQGGEGATSSTEDNATGGEGAPAAEGGTSPTVLCDPATHQEGLTADEGNSLGKLEDDLRRKLQEAVEEDPSLADDLPLSLQEDLQLDDHLPQSGSRGAGNGATLTVVEAAERFGATKDFIKLLSAVNPDILRRPGRAPARLRSTWRGPRQNLRHLYPQVLLPRSEALGKAGKKGEGRNKPLLVLALDQSSSISHQWAQRMRELASSVPEELIAVECCTFSTVYEPYDIHAEKNKIASGGTDFSAVEKFAREVAARYGSVYPKAVVVITDGEANFGKVKPSPEQLEKNWYWLLLAKGQQVGLYRPLITGDSVKQVKDFFLQF